MSEATRWGVRAIGAIGLAVLLAGCGGGGGSGSTGLITSEGSVVDDVRSTGTCDEFEGTPYCGTDSPNAVAPGGQSVSIVGTAVPTPVRTASPAPAGTATLDPGLSPTPAASGAPPTATATRTPPPATPRPSPSPGDQKTVRAQLDGFEDGSACATAARAAETEDLWKTAALVPLDPPDAVTVFPLPDGVAAPRDQALLCFDDPPTELPAELPTLADASPTVIFVLP